MKPERQSQLLLGVTRSKEKMWEYDVPVSRHIKITSSPELLFPLSIGMLGRLANSIINGKASIEISLADSDTTNQFPARFLDSFYGTRLTPELDNYLLLLGAASFYLTNMPGNSSVLIKRISDTNFNVGGNRLENLLLWILKGDFTTYFRESAGIYRYFINLISKEFNKFSSTGDGSEEILKNCNDLRRNVYHDGTPRDLLISDAIFTAAILRIQNSTWHCLPKYTGLSIEFWIEAIHRDSFIKEFWPSQHLLGTKGFFQGRSGTVQMPTSAGKTKAIDIIIRSAFLSDRTNLAIIVAPFKALCREIKENLSENFKQDGIPVNELTDVIQMDFDVGSLLHTNQILVLTPEKFVYLLRNVPEIRSTIGLIIYDEGHQFDSGIRGVTYELLLASLKDIGTENLQTVLISAVISNADAVNRWLNGEDSETAIGPHLKSTFRSIGFVSWTEKKQGELEFVSSQSADVRDFFVPYVIHQSPLINFKGETKERVFPEKGDGKSIALFLGLKLCQKGSVAVFCGTKVTASGLCELVVEAYRRGLSLAKPVEYSNGEEVRKLSELYKAHFGSKSSLTQCAIFGIFSHHGNIPHGLRLAVEHAFQRNMLKYVICTSTLAQGVNLPIRYLVITSVYQGQDRIKVRDFHNLLGRAGRSGMYTEGSIIFADPEVFDEKHTSDGSYRWEQFKKLLNEKNTEPCASTLATIFDRIKSDNGKRFLTREPLDIVKRFLGNITAMKKYAALIGSKFEKEGFTEKGVFSQLKWKNDIVSAIESYLMSHIDWSDEEQLGENVEKLAESTLAYSLADEEKKQQLKKLFRQISENIQEKIPEVDYRKVYGKTLLGVSAVVEIQTWVSENKDSIESCETPEALFEAIWPVFSRFIQNQNLNNLYPDEFRKKLAVRWINGDSYKDLHEMLTQNGVVFGSGKRPRKAKIDHVVDVCESGFGFESSLIIGAIVEILKNIEGDDELPVIKVFMLLQKSIRYGLPSRTDIDIYEMGFCDRVIAQELKNVIEEVRAESDESTIRKFENRRSVVADILGKYPSYFIEIGKTYLQT